MKVYELWFRNGEEDDFVLWVTTDRIIESPSAIKIKLIDIPENSPGIDLKII